MPTEIPKYRYQGARAMVLLHEEHLTDFVAVWRRAKAAGLALPETADPSYVSLEALLLHVLRAARGYMTWMCESLGLDDPKIDEAPPIERIADEADTFLRHVLARWRTPLAGVPEERFDELYKSRWGVVYCIDAMLEHAVMHPIRHAFQLRRLMEAGGKAK